MTKLSETPPSLQDQLLDIQNEAKKNKVQLTPEVEAYIREHLEAVQNKLANREEVMVDDMKFMQDVRLWVSLPEEWRGRYRGIEEAINSKEVQAALNRKINFNEAVIEAQKRKISFNQWLDLLHVAETIKKDKKWIKEKEWIDETFRFPGFNRIETVEDLEVFKGTSLTCIPAGLIVHGFLSLIGCTSLTSLPADLEVNGALNLSDCTSLTYLPINLKIHGNVHLNDCTSLTSPPAGLEVKGYLDLSGCTSLTFIPADLKVGGELSLENCSSLKFLPAGLKLDGSLVLVGCTALTTLPTDLKINKNLYLTGCTFLKSLPAGLEVREDLYLSKNLHTLVKKDAKRLKKEGKIKGEIKYE